MKMVQILLSKPLTVNLGVGESGELETVQLQAGLQEVEERVANHWFVEAHSQEIPQNAVQNQELVNQLELANQELDVLKTQSQAADKKINELSAQLTAKDKELSDCKLLIKKAQQGEAKAIQGEQNALKAVTTLEAELAKAKQPVTQE